MSASIQLPPGVPGARILGFGSYRPRRRGTNDELAQTMDTNDEWIQARGGIAERPWDLTDRSTAVIFADGAGAAVVGPSDEPSVGPVVWGSDGDLHEAIAIPEGEA